MANAMVNVGLWLTKWVTIPVCILMLLLIFGLWLAEKRKQGKRAIAQYKCMRLQCGLSFVASELEWDGQRCPRCNGEMVQVRKGW